MHRVTGAAASEHLELLTVTAIARSGQFQNSLKLGSVKKESGGPRDQPLPGLSLDLVNWLLLWPCHVRISLGSSCTLLVHHTLTQESLVTTRLPRKGTVREIAPRCLCKGPNKTLTVREQKENAVSAHATHFIPTLHPNIQVCK